MSAATVERKYVLTRVRAGDYILPSNDGHTLWRVCRYVDGPSMGLDPEDFPRDFEAWQIREWTGALYAGILPRDFEDLDRWEIREAGYATRREAIDAALRLSGEPSR